MIFYSFCKVFVPRSEGPPLKERKKVKEIFCDMETFVLAIKLMFSQPATKILSDRNFFPMTDIAWLN